MKQKYLYFFYIIAFALTACADSAKKKGTSISGEIVEPKTPFMVILKDHKVLDTLPLDENNQFYYRFSEPVESGLYTFLHNYNTYYESQMFYIESGDSLQLRLNTQDFDKSIMYSGDDAAANNFLMTLFLDSKENGKMLPDYYKYGPADFVAEVDSIGTGHRNVLYKLKQKQLISNDFKNLAEQAVGYALYDLKERYYFLVNKYNQQLKAQLPADFLAYRKKADFNQAELQTYYIYQYFLSDYLKNRATSDCLNQNKSNRECFVLSSKRNLKSRFKLADSIFTLKSLRNRFLTRIGGRLIVHSQTDKAVDSIVSFLADTKYETDDLQQIKDLATVQKRQFLGDINNLYLSDIKGQEVQISNLLTKPTVFFYWSMYYKYHHLHQHKKIKKLKNQYPQLHFIGINIDVEKPEMWKSSLTNFGYTNFSEFQLVCPPEERDYYRNYLDKLVFVGTNGRVLANNLGLRDPKLEEELQVLVQP